MTAPIQSSRGGNLLPLLRRGRQRLVLLIVAFVLPLSAAMLYIQQTHPLYDVTANLLLPAPNSTNARDMRSSRQDRERMATQAELFTSRDLVERAVRKVLNETTKNRSNSPSHSMSDPARPASALVAGRLQAKPIVGTEVLNVRLRWHDAEMGTRLLQAICQEYETFLRGLQRDKFSHLLTTLAKSEQELRDQLDQLEVEYRRVRRESSLIGRPEEGLSLHEKLLQGLGSSLTETRANRIALENRLAALQLLTDRSAIAHANHSRTETELVTASALQPVQIQSDSEPSPRTITIGDGTAPAAFLRAEDRTWGALQILSEVQSKGVENPSKIQEALFQAEVRRQSLVERFGPRHPEVRAVQKEIADWNRRLESVVARAPLTLQRELDAARRQEDRLQLLYDDQLARARDLDQDRLRQMHLQRRIKQLEPLHANVLEQLTQLKVSDALAQQGRIAQTVIQLDRPDASLEPAWPDKRLVGTCGLLVGLLLVSLVLAVPDSRQ